VVRLIEGSVVLARLIEGSIAPLIEGSGVIARLIEGSAALLIEGSAVPLGFQWRMRQEIEVTQTVVAHLIDSVVAHLIDSVGMWLRICQLEVVATALGF